MATRHSEYSRIAGDQYVTPRWVYDALIELEPWARYGWDPCPPDHTRGVLELPRLLMSPHVVTNPPFRGAEKIIRHAIELTRPHAGEAAFLLPMAYDCAKGRVDLFRNRPFKKKIVLLERIRWENVEQKPAGPSMNHAWFVFCWAHSGPPTMEWI